MGQSSTQRHKRLLQIERHRAFVAVQILEVRTVARTARLLAAGILHQGVDLDDIGAPVRELPYAGRPERTRVRSSTVKRDRACEARGKGIQYVSR